MIGAIAHTTMRLHLGTAVTSPTVRVHPAKVAQAAATAASMQFCKTKILPRLKVGRKKAA